MITKLSEQNLYSLRDAIRAIGLNADVYFDDLAIGGIIARSKNRWGERFLAIWSLTDIQEEPDGDEEEMMSLFGLETLNRLKQS